PRRPPSSSLFPYTTLFRSERLVLLLVVRGALLLVVRRRVAVQHVGVVEDPAAEAGHRERARRDRQAHRRREPRARHEQAAAPARSEEHTSELQSLAYLVCR